MTQTSSGAATPDLAVVDTGIVSAILVGRKRPRETALLSRYDGFLRGRSLVLSFATVSELRFGALNAGWEPGRTQLMEKWLSNVATVVMPDNDLVNVCANLRNTCRQNGLALHEKIHDSDRWIASTAIRYSIPLISDDGIFQNVPGLTLLQDR